MSGSRVDGITLRQAALTVGFAYLLNPVPFAEFKLLPGLVTLDPHQTAANFAAHHAAFLGGIFCYLVNFLEDIVIAWGLYVLLAPVNRGLSLLAMLLRLVYTVVALTGMFNLVTIYRMVTTPAYAGAFGSQQFAAQIDLLYHMWRYDYAFGIGAIFSLHLLLVGFLIIRSRYMPWWLGAIIVINGLGWIVSNLQPYFYPGVALGFIGITYFGELVMMLWLLTFGWTIERRAIGSAPP